MTPTQKAAMQQAIEALEQAADVLHKDFMLPEAAEALREALAEPAAEPEMHEAMCSALTGGKCNCPTSPAFVDKAWAQAKCSIPRND